MLEKHLYFKMKLKKLKKCCIFVKKKRQNKYNTLKININ